MNRNSKILTTILLCIIVFLASALLAISVSAEDITIDVSSATESNGKYGQSIRIDTPEQLKEQYEENFDPCTMTANSVIIAEYSISDSYDGSEPPVEFILQTWKDGPQPRNPHVLKEWNKVAPYEYTANKAYFSYDDIVKSWGIEDFSTCYAVYVGDTGYHVTVTSLKVTETDPSKAFLLNVNEDGVLETSAEPAQTEAAAVVTEAETTYETGRKTTAAETRATYDPGDEAKRIAENAPKSSTGGAAVVVVIIAVLAACGGFGYFYFIRKGKK